MAFTQEEIEKLYKLKDEDLVKALNGDMLGLIPVELGLKWCQAIVRLSNKENAKRAKENREAEIKRLSDLKIKELEELDEENQNNSNETN